MNKISASMVKEGWQGPGRQDRRIEPLKLEEDGLADQEYSRSKENSGLAFRKRRDNPVHGGTGSLKLCLNS